MIFEQIAIGGDRNFSYLIGDPASGLAAVVDPSYNPDRMLVRARHHGLTIRYLINTHGHGDHTNGNAAVVSATGAQTVGHSLLKPDIAVDDGGEIVLGVVTLIFIHTPGHTRDAVCILAGDCLLTGDTLFVGKVGGTGFGDDARQLYESLHHKLMTLPEQTRVFPGHDYGVAPHSTIGHEKRTNPFILQENFEKFLDLKKNWAEYKRMHGIR